MTENTDDTDTAAEVAAEAAGTDRQDAPDPVGTEAVSTEADESADSAKLRKEAARYRRSLRDTEAERDSLRDRLTTLQRAEVERIATADDGLARADDLWLSGLDLASLLDDDGNVDTIKVREAVAAVLEARPHWRRAAPVGFDGGVRQPAPAGVTMQQLLQGGKRR